MWERRVGGDKKTEDRRQRTEDRRQKAEGKKTSKA